MGIDLLPTHHCFDDALDYIAMIVTAMPSVAHRDDFWLVHAICIMPAGSSHPGHLFVHAWVEDRDVVIDAGLLAGERVWFQVAKAEHYARLQVQDVTRYTCAEAYEENRRTNMYGPWKAEYLALLRPRVSSTAATAVNV